MNEAIKRKADPMMESQQSGKQKDNKEFICLIG